MIEPVVSAKRPNQRLPWWRSLAARAHAVDAAAFGAVARVHAPAVDRPLQLLANAADHSKLSVAAAGILASTGGAQGRRAALTGLACVAVASASANLGGKVLTRRTRPDRDAAGVPAARHVRMPLSKSFPSGHTASAFAFAAGVGHAWSAPALPLTALAAIVGYSRVHTGVHYPGDVLGGAVWGLAAARVTWGAVDRLVTASEVTVERRLGRGPSL